MRFCRAADLDAALDEDDAEWRIRLEGPLEHEAVAGLEDVKRQEHPREKDAAEQEERQRARLSHGQTVLCDLE